MCDFLPHNRCLSFCFLGCLVRTVLYSWCFDKYVAFTQLKPMQRPTHRAHLKISEWECSGCQSIPLFLILLLFIPKTKYEHDWRVLHMFSPRSVSFHIMQSVFLLLLSASQDRSCNGNAHLDLFHYLLFSYSYYPARFTESDLGCKMHWVCLIYTGKDLFGWHA